MDPLGGLWLSGREEIPRAGGGKVGVADDVGTEKERESGFLLKGCPTLVQEREGGRKAVYTSKDYGLDHRR